MPDDEEKDWKGIFEKFAANENISRVLSQVNLPPLESDEHIKLFFAVLGDRGNKLNKNGELAAVFGMSAQVTKIIVSTLRDVAAGESWRNVGERDDIRRSGWSPER